MEVVIIRVKQKYKVLAVGRIARNNYFCLGNKKVTISAGS